jgi:hypothetical protein
MFETIRMCITWSTVAALVVLHGWRETVAAQALNRAKTFGTVNFSQSRLCHADLNSLNSVAVDGASAAGA